MPSADRAGARSSTRWPTPPVGELAPGALLIASHRVPARSTRSALSAAARRARRRGAGPGGRGRPAPTVRCTRASTPSTVCSTPNAASAAIATTTATSATAASTRCSTCRTGIPITLAVVYMEVARRAGLRTDGINFPGHFLVRAYHGRRCRRRAGRRSVSRRHHPDRAGLPRAAAAPRRRQRAFTPDLLARRRPGGRCSCGCWST